MPEIKHSFISGKMNKDLDERIVPNGEYRDAFNIQVSTSEGSDVGAVQNVLGNSIISGQSEISNDAVCIATIADEKNDKIYWFVKDVANELIETLPNLEDPANWVYNSSILTPTHSADNLVINTIVDPLLAQPPLYADTQYPGFRTKTINDFVNGRKYEVKVVFGNNDIGGAERASSSGNIYTAQNKVFVAGITDIYGTTGNSFYRPYNNNVGPNNTNHMVPNGNTNITTGLEYQNSFVFNQASNNGSTALRLQFEFINGQSYNKSLEILSVSFTEQPASYILEYDVKTDTVTPVVVDLQNEALQFNTSKLVTGINIIDGLLFWTDGFNEPKKINIQRCKDGTNNFTTNTQLLVEDLAIRDLQLKDITVIKKAPKTPLVVKKVQSRNPVGNYSGVVTISDVNSTYNSIINSSQGSDIHNFQSLNVGDTFQTIIETDDSFSNDFTLSWSDGDTVILKAFDSPGVPPPTPLDLSNNWHIKGYITNWVHNQFNNFNLNLLNPAPNTTLGTDWSTIGTLEYGPWEYTGTAQYYKLVQFSYYSSVGQEINKGRHYRISFNLNESSNSNLKGKLTVSIRTKDNEPFYQHYNDVSGGAGNYVIEIDDTPYSQSGATSLFGSASLNYPSSVVFEARNDNNGNIFEGEISDVTIERIDQAPAKAEIKITNINGVPPIPQGADTQLEYLIDVSTTADILFEKKLPRFSYRYKYEDGEYSTFAPFTNVVFSPGTFGYLATDGFNAGMNNTVKSLTLESINKDKPDDVVAVDILYKEEGSPSVYVVDTLKQGENFYEIKKETINGILPDNQILRLWDNVPTSAISQEVIGNRILYGNYTQNYDLVKEEADVLVDYNLDLSVNVDSLRFNSDNYGRSSIKSSREYQLGVVYTDSYGRETPVLTNSSSTIKLDKSFSDEQNSFLVQVKTNGHPVNMEYFKFYVKDTGGEYYNMAMDRYFDAEDGNVWLSFPSVDRNKIDIDDNIILKKGIESNSVLNKARYKVLDISNEAPDYIKKEERLTMKKYHGGSGNELFIDPPQFEGNSFSLEPSKFSNSIHQNFASHYNNRPSGVDYYVIFSHNTFNNVSQRYKITSFESDTTAYVGVDGKFNFDVMQFTDDPTGLNGASEVIEQTYLSIVREESVNSPKFDGRFFVKIKKDGDFNKIDPNSTLSTEYVTSTETTKKIYLANSSVNDNANHPTNHGGDVQFWQGYADSDSPGDFQLGRSVTTVTLGPNDPQVGTLKDYWERRIEMLQKLGDYDYALDGTSTSDPGYSVKTSVKGTMMAWKAYFRGINTETVPTYSMNDRSSSIDIDEDATNNKFEDVWFISRLKHSASIPIDKGLEISDNYPQPSSSNPTVWGTRNVGWESWSSTDSSALELSFGGISANSWENQDPAPHPDNDYSFFDIGQSNLNYASANGEFVKNLSAGSRFTFKEDPTKTIYTITDVHLFHRILYDNLEEATGHSPPNNFNHYKGQVRGLLGVHDICDDNGTLPVTYRSTSFLDASNFVVVYKLFLDKQCQWNPAGAAGVDYAKITNGLDLKLPAGDANPVVSKSNGDANITVNSITATDVNTSEVHKLEVGLVLYKHDTHAMSQRSRSIITHITDNLDGTFTLQFKCYQGDQRDINGTASDGEFGGIVATDDLYFAQWNMNGVSKNSAKNINYFHACGINSAETGIDALGYTMQFLTASTSEKEDDVLSSTDPAIFETEPKTDKDLDVYYEASRAIPIVENVTKISEIIPVGSTVEHESSSAIPPNTTITSVSSDGVITLSNDVNVENTIPIYREDQFDGI